MLCQVELVVVALGAMLCVLAQAYVVCPECVNGKYNCQNIYPRCGPKVDHLCFRNGVYYCAEPKTCPECSVPGYKCVNKHPFCHKEATTGLCYQNGQLFCVEKDLPPTTAAPTTLPTTPKPTTPAPTTVAVTTVNPLNRCLTPGLISGCLLQCPPTWIPLIGKVCLEGTCCTKLP